MKRARKSDGKIYSLRRMVFAVERPGERAAAARALAHAIIGGEMSSQADFEREMRRVVGADMVVCARDRIVFDRVDGAELPVLPAGYFYKGGAARLVLGRVLGVSLGPPRDLDIVRFGGRWTHEDTRLSRELMPLDFERGQGVELSGHVATYLGSRDLSINEVFCGGAEIQATPAAVLDTIGGVLRPCRYGYGSIRRPPTVRGGTVAKMLRLRAEGRIDGLVWNVVGVPADQPIAPFDLALQLDKAFARSRSVAEEFLRDCHAVGLLTLDESDPEWLMKGVELVSAGVFEPNRFYRNVPAELLPRVLE